MFRRTLVRYAEAQATQAAAATPIPQIPKQLQFRITRTHSNNLPIYLNYTGGARRIPQTEIRRIEGSMDQAHLELQKLVGSHVNVKRSNGKIFVTGNFVSKVRKHLQAMGF